MTAALYELLAQAYTYVNSVAYRNASGEAGRAREIRTLTISYPSGMIQEEQRRLAAQAQKAINIFAMTLGKSQRCKPEMNLGIDEASAVPSDLYLERAADARAGSTAVVHHACTRTAAARSPSVDDMPEMTAARAGRGPAGRARPATAARRPRQAEQRRAGNLRR